MVMVASGTPDFLEPISPSRDEPTPPMLCPPVSGPQSAAARPARAENERASGSNHAATSQQTGTRLARTTNEGVMRSQRMPMAPTDPNAFFRAELPLPPTMNYSGRSPSSGLAGAGQRLNAAGLAENSRRLSNQKPFEHYASPPTTSPYALLGASTNNGTVDPYTAYVRPAQEQQQQANQEFDRSTSNAQNAPDQPAPVYPAVFLNNGAYYPSYGAGR